MIRNTRFLACEYKIGWFIFHVSYMRSFITIVVFFLQHSIPLKAGGVWDWLMILQSNMIRILACNWEMERYVKNWIFVWFFVFNWMTIANMEYIFSERSHEVVVCTIHQVAVAENMFQSFLSVIYEDKDSQIYNTAFLTQPS